MWEPVLAIAILSGWIIGKFGLEKYVADWVYKVKASHANESETQINFYERIKAGYEAVTEIVWKNLGLYYNWNCCRCRSAWLCTRGFSEFDFRKG